MTEHELTHNNISNWGTIEYGESQGSVLGPLLYLLYINDLPKITNSENLKINFKPILFADNKSTIVSNPSVTDL
jgi:hypothetical protein